MTIEELYNELIKMNIPEEEYYLHGLYGSQNDGEKIALTIKKGKYHIEYEVYYKERGKKYSDKIFKTETEACKYILNNFILFNKIKNLKRN